MPLLEIIPKDSLLFRDGKPFTAGSSHSAESIFPPKPSVFAGFIRSKIFIDNWQDDEKTTWEKVKSEIGEKNDIKSAKLDIKAVFIKKGNEYYVQTPLDIVKEKRGNSIKVLKPKDFSKEFSYSTNISVNSLPFAPKEIEFAETCGGFISLTDLKKYLKGEEIEKIEIKHKDDFVKSEPRVGIAVDSSKNIVKESQLYSVEFLRFIEDSGFAVYYEGVNFPQKGEYFIGGEKRQVNFSVKKDNPGLVDLEKIISNNKKFKIILISPVEINDNEIEPSGLREKLNNVGEFITACVKTELIGGWDIAAGKPKPIKKYYSVGSVFYYSLKDNNKVKDLLKLNFDTISQEGKLGFGRVLIGIW